MKKPVLLVVLLMAFYWTLTSFAMPQDQKKAAPWNIPANYKTMKNPDKGKAESEKLGKALYAKHCRSCHGNTGLGDGPKAKNLETFPGSFDDAKFQSQSDGELYYKSIIGRDEMPNFEKNIPDEEARWAVINYVRTLKK
jgi:mono/diheme cytochrome c family protein